MSPVRFALAALAIGVLVLLAAIVLFEPVRNFAAATGLLMWLFIAGLIALGVWSTRHLPRAPRGSKSPPGAQWFPTGTWWGHRKRD